MFLFRDKNATLKNAYKAQQRTLLEPLFERKGTEVPVLISVFLFYLTRADTTIAKTLVTHFSSYNTLSLQLMC